MAAIKPAPITLASLKFVKPADLAQSLRQQGIKTAVIDVRDNDHVGGHLKGSQWVPINQLDARMPELLRTNQDSDRIVFHCMLSQQRGPKAALAYARAKAYEVAKKASEEGKDGVEPVEEGMGKIGNQEVCVLEGGFETWQRYYGEDKTLTAGYEKDLWE